MRCVLTLQRVLRQCVNMGGDALANQGHGLLNLGLGHDAMAQHHRNQGLDIRRRHKVTALQQGVRL